MKYSTNFFSISTRALSAKQSSHFESVWKQQQNRHFESVWKQQQKQQQQQQH
jgi:hypothetical protein